MTKEELDQPIDGSDVPDAATTDDELDAEGHSIGLLMGVNALGGTRSADARPQSKKADEDLPPLSKKWPSMRDDKKA